MPDPEMNKVLSNILIGIKHFCYNVRWKYFLNERDRLKDLNLGKDNNDENKHPLNDKKKKKRNSVKLEYDSKETDLEWYDKNKLGLKSCLNSLNTSNTAPLGSSAVELFIKEIESTLIERVYESHKDGNKKAKIRKMRR